MANEIYISATTGMSITLQLYNGVNVIGSPFSAIEIAGLGEYVADMPAGTPYGRYLIVATSGNLKIASAQIMWDGSYEIVESLAVLQGLNPSAPMTVTPSSRTAVGINLNIGGDGETSSIVTRV